MGKFWGGAVPGDSLRVFCKLRWKVSLGRSFLGGHRNWGPAHLTCKLSICWGGTDLGTHAHWGATVPPFLTVVLSTSSKIIPSLNRLFSINDPGPNLLMNYLDPESSDLNLTCSTISRRYLLVTLKPHIFSHSYLIEFAKISNNK